MKSYTLTSDEIKALGKSLPRGSRNEIAITLEIDRMTVSDVFSKGRYHEDILREAITILKRNKDLAEEAKSFIKTA